MLPDWREVVVKKEGGGFLLLTVVEFDIQPLSKRQWDEYEGFCCWKEKKSTDCKSMKL